VVPKNSAVSAGCVSGRRELESTSSRLDSLEHWAPAPESNDSELRALRWLCSQDYSDHCLQHLARFGVLGPQRMPTAPERVVFCLVASARPVRQVVELQWEARFA
jgi:hypothetical protein